MPRACAQHKIYTSPPFPTAVSIDDADSQFGRLVSQSGLRFDKRRGSNRQLGNKIVYLHWKPRS